MTYLFNKEEITLEHSLFDVVIFDIETNRIKDAVSDEEILEAKLKKAEYLLDKGAITEIVVEAKKTK